MAAMAVPLAADKLDAWEAWVAELKGPRKAEFDDTYYKGLYGTRRGRLLLVIDGVFLGHLGDLAEIEVEARRQVEQAAHASVDIDASEWGERAAAP